MKESIHIYVCHHTDGNFFSDEVFKPIQVGRAASEKILPIQGDDTGKNLSSRNPEYCELTAVYWAWMNDTSADWVGLMHYRRFLDFSRSGLNADRYGCITSSILNDDHIKAFGLNAKSVFDLIEKNPDVSAIVPKKWSVKNIGFKSLFDHYAFAPHHYKNDLNITREVIADLYPGDVDAFDRVMDSDSGYFTNIFLLRRYLFESYCEWLFAILFEVERRVDLTNYSSQARRIYGYLGERLFNIFMESHFLDGVGVLELDRVFFERQDISKKALRVEFDSAKYVLPNNAVTVVIASDDNFVPHLAALIESIKANLSKDRFLDLVIFDGGITASNKFLLRLQFEVGFDFGKIRFIDCRNLHSDIATHMHFSVATFYRLSIGDLLPNHKRALYVDCDAIVLADLAKLFDFHLSEGQVVAAAPDVIMKSFINRGVPAMREAGGAVSKIYLSEYVGLGDGFADYFQAGVILFDLEKYRNLDVVERAIDDLAGKKYWFLDQDILNKYLIGRVALIDTSWNCVNSVNDISEYLDLEWREKAKQDFHAPKIVHYAGFEAKPWNNKSAPLAHYYWFFLRKTFWYESVFQRFQSPNMIEYVHVHGVAYRTLAAAWRRLPLFVRRRAGHFADLLKRIF
jgi:lipopolysaccharide biosynthesis glycosyltransferase